MTHISANSILPARRSTVRLTTQDGHHLVGAWALPEDTDPSAVLVFAHPLPTHGGSMDSHLIRKASWRLPALAGIGVLRFNTRGTVSTDGASDGQFESNVGEGLDLAAALAEVARAGFGSPWLVGWSFGTDVILRWGNVDPVVGAVLLSPPGRWSDDQDVAGWNRSGRPITALVPELDEFAPPEMVRARFAGLPNARVVAVPGAQHLWVGEKYTRIALDGIAETLRPGSTPLPTTYDGPMQRWTDTPVFSPMDRQA